MITKAWDEQLWKWTRLLMLNEEGCGRKRSWNCLSYCPVVWLEDLRTRGNSIMARANYESWAQTFVVTLWGSEFFLALFVSVPGPRSKACLRILYPSLCYFIIQSRDCWLYATSWWFGQHVSWPTLTLVSRHVFSPPRSKDISPPSIFLSRLYTDSGGVLSLATKCSVVSSSSVFFFCPETAVISEHLVTFVMSGTRWSGHVKYQSDTKS